MSARALLHVRAAVWGESDNRVALLLLAGESPDQPPGGLEDPLVSALLPRGMPVLRGVDPLILRRPPGWRARMGDTGHITLEWPGRRPLLNGIPLPLPDAWRWVARRQRAVALIAGGHLTEIPAQPAAVGALAESGALVGAAVEYLET
ncbi:hypothetical protein [Actinokineospora sp. NPDC004072]